MRHAAITTMRWTTLIPAAFLAAGLAPGAPAHAAVSDFRLPTDSSQQQPPPDRQGPVAPDVPASRQPAPAPTPTPTPSAAATPAPVVTPPVLVSPVTRATSEPAPARQAATTAAPSTTTAVATGANQPAEPTSSPAFAPPAASPTAAPVPGAGAVTPATMRDSRKPWWPWALGALAGLGALAAGAWLWRRRRAEGPAAVPDIARPRVPAAPVPADPGPAASLALDKPAQPAPSPAAPYPAMPQPSFAEPLQVTLEPLRLSLTLMNATLAYRLKVANGGTAELTGLSIGADMISAHASLSREEQLSGPAAAAGNAQPQRIERLAPGESRIVEGEFRLPFQQIVPIRQGSAALLLPLARFRVEAEGARPVVRTFLVGQPGASERLQPFRLDLGPRVYPTLAQHAFA